MNTLSYKNIIAVAILLTVVGFLTIAKQPQMALGSIRSGDEYMATSTASNTMYGATITGDALIRTGYGSLGSVIITGSGTGIWSIYNATTTNVLARTGNIATSSILLASFPASAAAGTYTFDVTYTDGLLIELVSGVMSTSTITYR